jgi:hypothetical protein
MSSRSDAHGASSISIQRRPDRSTRAAEKISARAAGNSSQIVHLSEGIVHLPVIGSAVHLEESRWTLSPPSPGECEMNDKSLLHE